MAPFWRLVPIMTLILFRNTGIFTPKHLCGKVLFLKLGRRILIFKVVIGKTDLDKWKVN